jgi:heparan-alpha-glucosaminide N-acetyltransferase
MIFVNYGGGGYWFFNHSLWNGLTVADLVFPWFIFIMGVAMPLSFQALLKNEVTPMQILAKIVRRAIILFALGMFINNGQYILYWRIPGVLQRFAIAYLITGIVILFVPTIGKRQKVTAENLEETDNLLNSASPHLPKYKSHFFPFALHWAVALLLLAIWFIITFFLEVPGCPRGYIGPGGLADNGKWPKCTGGAAKYIDEMVFGPNHIYTHPTCQEMYQTGAYDPEGLLGNLTSIFLCFLGVVAGRALQVHTVPISRIWRWLAWGVFFCGLAALLCKMSQNDGWIPINKNLWSASFVFLMGGAGFIVFSLFYVLVDVWKIWNGAPFIYVGMNSIIIYVGHETLGEYFPFSFATEYSYGSHAMALGSNILGVSSWVTIAYLMYRNSFFVNI